MKCAAITIAGQRVLGVRNIGSTVRHIGKKRMDEIDTASATAGKAVFAAIDAKNNACAGPAQISSDEPNAAPAGNPASRASPPTPIIATATKNAGPVNACRTPSR